MADISVDSNIPDNKVTCAYEAFKVYADERRGLEAYTGPFREMGEALFNAYPTHEKVILADKVCLALQGEDVEPFTQRERLILNATKLGDLYQSHKDSIDAIIKFSEIMNDPEIQNKADIKKSFFILFKNLNISYTQKSLYYDQIFYQDRPRKVLLALNDISPLSDKAECLALYNSLVNINERQLQYLKLLKKAKLSNVEFTKFLYELIKAKYQYRSSEDLGKLSEALKILSNGNIPAEGDTLTLYTKIVGSYSEQAELAAAYSILWETGIPYEASTSELYTRVEQKWSKQSQATAIRTLWQAGIPYEGDSLKLYERVNESGDRPEELATVFSLMYTVGIPYNANTEKLYEDISSDNLAELAKALQWMHDAKITSAGTGFKLYENLIQKSFQCKKRAKAFVELTRAGIPLEQETLSLYNDIIDKGYECEEKAALFVSLANAGIAPQGQSLKLYQAIIDNHYNRQALVAAFITLSTLGISPEGDSFKFYQALIDEKYHPDKLAEALKALKDQGIPTIGQGLKLYEYLIEHPYTYDDLSSRFESLRSLKIPIDDEGLKLYKVLIEKSYVRKNLAHAFKILNDGGISASGDTLKLYFMLAESDHYTENLAALFCELNKVIPFNEANRELYSLISKRRRDAIELEGKISYLLDKRIENEGLRLKFLNLLIMYASSYEDRLLNCLDCFNQLKIAHIPQEGEGCFLYEALLENSYHAQSYVDFTLFLKDDIGIPYAGENIHFYKTIFKNLYGARLDYLRTLFSELKNLGLTYEHNKKLYQDTRILKGEKNTLEEFIKLFKTLDHCEFNCKDFPEYFNENILIVYGALIYDLFNQLKTLGFSPERYHFIYTFILSELSKDNPRVNFVLNVTDQLKDYDLSNALSLNNENLLQNQYSDIEKIIEEERESLESFELGPLNKSKSTYHIESLLNEIVDRYEKANLTQNHLGHYILIIGNDNPINLTLLLRNSNSSHLCLDENLIIKIATVFEGLTEGLRNSYDNTVWGSASDVFQDMGSDNQAISFCRKALKLYGTGCSKNISRLFRSEALLSNGYDISLNPSPEKNALAYFLLGCIVNYEATRLYQEREEKIQDANEVSTSDKPAGQANTHTKLTRFLTITGSQSKAMTANRYSLFPGSSSFSFNNTGADAFKQDDSIEIIVPNPPHYNSEAVKSSLSEVILPQGESGLVTPLNNKTLIWTIVRSPTFQPKDHYWSEQALVDAFQNYLSKEYKNENSVITIDGKNIYRPNHNVTHTYRVMTAIEMVIQYFSHFAEDGGFKQFCQTISAEEIEWLRVAAAFSISGRECEVNAGDNLDLYNSYREASQHHFDEFIAKTAPKGSEERQQRMSHVVRYMGNPHYLFSKDPKKINDLDDIHELDQRNYYYSILSIAHKLDLPRCYPREKFHNSMALCRELSETSTAQQRAYESMIRYQIEHIKAHGGKLECDMDAAGKLSNTMTSYENKYAEASLSINALFTMTETVTRPIFAHNPVQQAQPEEDSSRPSMRK